MACIVHGRHSNIFVILHGKLSAMLHHRQVTDLSHAQVSTSEAHLMQSSDLRHEQENLARSVELFNANFSIDQFRKWPFDTKPDCKDDQDVNKEINGAEHWLLHYRACNVTLTALGYSTAFHSLATENDAAAECLQKQAWVRDKLVPI